VLSGYKMDVSDVRLRTAISLALGIIRGAVVSHMGGENAPSLQVDKMVDEYLARK